MTTTTSTARRPPPAQPAQHRKTDVARVNDLLQAAGLQLACGMPLRHELAMAVRLACLLQEQLQLDKDDTAAILHYLHQIDCIADHLAHRRDERQLSRPRDGERPWREPHGGSGA